MRPEPDKRQHFMYYSGLKTRWSDNDIYGHVNNVTYYSYFDTVVNEYLIEQGGLDIHQGSSIALVVETHCNFFKPLSFPERLEIGLGVDRLGASSVRYRLGIFSENDAESAASGHFVHVFVDRENRRSMAIPQSIRSALQHLQGSDEKGSGV